MTGLPVLLVALSLFIGALAILACIADWADSYDRRDARARNPRDQAHRL